METKQYWAEEFQQSREAKEKVRELSAASEIARMMHGIAEPFPRWSAERLASIPDEPTLVKDSAPCSGFIGPSMVSVSHWGMFPRA